MSKCENGLVPDQTDGLIEALNFFSDLYYLNIRQLEAVKIIKSVGR